MAIKLDFSKLSADTAHRFRAVAEQLVSFATSFPEQPTLLDVGGYPGTFCREFVATRPRWSATTLDTPKENLPNYVSGSGAKIEFPDESFDAVTSIDTLEHIPSKDRPAFLGELCRVSKQIVVVAAPFYHPSTAGVEGLLNSTHEKVFGSPHPWLHEHVQYGLPNLQEVVKTWPEGFGIVDIRPSYELQAWLTWQALSLFKKLRGDFDNVWDGFDNQLAESPTPKISTVAYRYLIVAERGAESIEIADRLIAPPQSGLEVVELARMYCRMLEMLSNEPKNEATQQLPSGMVDQRLKQALNAAEAEVQRLQKKLEEKDSEQKPQGVAQRASGLFKKFGRSGS